MNFIKRAFLFVGLLSSMGQSGRVLNSDFVEEVYIDNTLLKVPVAFEWAPDSTKRLFVTHQSGEVYVIENGVLNSTPFYKFAQTRKTSNENGLLGMAFDPNYLQNKFLYFFLSVSSREQQIIRLTDTNNKGGSETIIVRGLPTADANHNGGALATGPDGKIYWAVGDINSGDPSGLTTLKSKVGRANLDGTVPSDNPFYDDGNPAIGNNDYIWAQGFRNPFTMTFRPGFNQLWLNVVGSNYEQIFIVEKGSHGGWYSGSNNELNFPPNYLSPVLAYGTNAKNSVSISSITRVSNLVTATLAGNFQFHIGEKVTVSGVSSASFNGSFDIASVALNNPTVLTFAQVGSNEVSNNGNVSSTSYGGCIAGGAFTSAKGYGSAYAGDFFFGDYNPPGKLVRMTFDKAGKTAAVNVLVDSATRIVDVNVGPDGLIYYLGAYNTGKIYRLVPKSGVALTNSESASPLKNYKMLYDNNSIFDALRHYPDAAKVNFYSLMGNLIYSGSAADFRATAPHVLNKMFSGYLQVATKTQKESFKVLLISRH